MIKGFDGCSSREIAKAAGMNVALVNYYFRSKEKLFGLIFQKIMEEFVLSMIEVFRTERSLEDKMSIYIENEYDLLSKHPDLPNFIINEMNRLDGQSNEQRELFHKVAETGVFTECIAAQQAGRMRQVDLLSITLLILANCQYPVMAKNLMRSLHDMDANTYNDLLVEHKEHVIEMLLNYLFPNYGSKK